MGPNPQVFSQDLTWLFLFSRSFFKYISKFDVRMNWHQSNVFLQDFPNSFHCWLNLSILHSGVPQQFMVVFLIVILNIWRPKKSFTSISYPFSQRFMVLIRDHPLIIVLIVRIIFTHPKHFLSCFPFLSSEGHLFKYYSFQLAALILQSYRCINQISSNQFLISSF